MLGFTLLEVMIALLVITIGIGAVINTTSESGWKSSLLRHKTIAGWIAQNQIAEHRAKRIWNNASSRSGEVEMANAEWVWRLQISATDDPSLRRLDIEVFLKGEEEVEASATGFMGKL
jgi:general secretion pathway protein I